MQGDIVSQGLELLLYGMGTVVVFLTLLVASTAVMSRLIDRYFAEPEPPAGPAANLPRGGASPGENRELVAVISAAIQRYREK